MSNIRGKFRPNYTFIIEPLIKNYSIRQSKNIDETMVLIEIQIVGNSDFKRWKNWFRKCFVQYSRDVSTPTHNILRNTY